MSYFGYLCCCCLLASSLWRVRTQVLKYSMRDVSFDGKIEFSPNSPFLKKRFFFSVNNHCLVLQITTLISESHERSIEGSDV